MLFVRSPLRVSFFGGGSDIPLFFQNYGGAVISATINKYIYLSINRTNFENIRLVYSEIENIKRPEDIKHDLMREAIKHFRVSQGLEICSFADIPTKGTGLGSSSSFTVGLIKGLSELTEEHLSKYDIAKLACEIEIERCGSPIGWQDQYAASFGGINRIDFKKDSKVQLSPILCPQQTIDKWEKSLILVYSGIARSTNSILQEQSTNLRGSKTLVREAQRLVDMVDIGKKLFEDGDVRDFGKLLNEAWQRKKKLSSGINNDNLHQLYETLIANGAYGAKLLGAGGGGFFLTVIDENKKSEFVKSLKDFQIMDIKFEFDGAKVLVATK